MNNTDMLYLVLQKPTRQNLKHVVPKCYENQNYFLHQLYLDDVRNKYRNKNKTDNVLIYCFIKIFYTNQSACKMLNDSSIYAHSKPLTSNIVYSYEFGDLSHFGCMRVVNVPTNTIIIHSWNL